MLVHFASTYKYVQFMAMDVYLYRMPSSYSVLGVFNDYCNFHSTQACAWLLYL